MADSDPGERNYENMLKMLSDLNKDLEKLLEEMEKISVQATWMAYDMVVMRTNPTLAESMRRLEDAFLNCKEELEKNWQELFDETKRAQPQLREPRGSCLQGGAHRRSRRLCAGRSAPCCTDTRPQWRRAARPAPPV
ncbi:synaptonemal complex central element protein 3 [Neophocaena asiaeorientalis asiaeorientalis]|uniref:Synaptonemal complex central element protein 3 n=1 Tax=Neophocaena asiaeorientalis asiaeorientalis TaxID=1706337 RepID=A0A341AS74_NEOAA|nr:synaptonemal complex central element protein 3 [Neophocaena asiaeorientalis asiaeorientalis]